MKKELFATLLTAILIFSATTSVMAAKDGAGIDDPPGIPLYVIIEVSWDGTGDYGDWTVWGPKWDPLLGGTLLTTCTECLDMSNYEFSFRGNGKTVHFEEVMVPTVLATPQTKHVVLRDDDGDGTYIGSLTAMHYFPWRPEPDGSFAVLYFDRIDYEIAFDNEGNVIDFYYVQYEHKKLE
jgi:hypothetical protein